MFLLSRRRCRTLGETLGPRRKSARALPELRVFFPRAGGIFAQICGPASNILATAVNALDRGGSMLRRPYREKAMGTSDKLFRCRLGLLACGLSLLGCDSASDETQRCSPPASCLDGPPGAGGAPGDDLLAAGGNAQGDGGNNTGGGNNAQGGTGGPLQFPELPAGPPATQVDLLFVVDNSMGMLEKQKILGTSAVELIKDLVAPACVDASGAELARPASPDEPCPDGSTRESKAVEDLHVGVITTSLGGYGSPNSCVAFESLEGSEQAVDMAHLLGSLPRAADAGGEAFLRWSPGEDVNDFGLRLFDTISSAGEYGCGYEAPLESWYRFLVDPAPYQSIIKLPCADDPGRACIAPEQDAQGGVLVDQTVLQQRQEFLRPDSLVVIVMLSDENDCSFIPNGHSWQLAHPITDDSTGINQAYRAAASCEANPNDLCCQSCGDPLLSGCPSEMDAGGNPVPVGCAASPIYENESADNLEDQANLRCFQQKRRFGVDYLYPTSRYVNALRLTRFCPSALDLDPAKCAEAELVDNPLLASRSASRVILTGIVGVPWQDLAVDPAATKLELRPTTGPEGINWDWIIGERYPADGTPKPLNPLMQESIDPRSGTVPSTGEAVAGPDASYLANSINGHEWNNTDRDTLQYACINPKLEEQECLSHVEYNERLQEGGNIPGCECTWYGEEGYNNPVCQASDGSFSLLQAFDRAFPSLRQLQVLHDLDKDAVVGSACMKDRDAEAPFYQATMDSLLRTVRSRIAQ